MMELVDMNSLGLFDFIILSVQVGFTLYLTREAQPIWRCLGYKFILSRAI